MNDPQRKISLTYNLIQNLIKFQRHGYNSRLEIFYQSVRRKLLKECSSTKNTSGIGNQGDYLKIYIYWKLSIWL